MSQKSRQTVLEMVEKKTGFPFDERDLSPKMRRHVTTLATKVDRTNSIWNLRAQAEKRARDYSGFSAVLAIIGVLILIVSLATPLSQELVGAAPYIAIGVLFLFGAYGVYHESENAKRETKNLESQRTSAWEEIHREISGLAEEAYVELSSLHEARIRPTVKHVTVDFADIIRAARGKGIILEAIECPNCGASTRLPKRGGSFECQHCGKTIKATNVFDILKDFVGFEEENEEKR